MSSPEKRAHYDATGDVPGDPPSARTQALSFLSALFEDVIDSCNPDDTPILDVARGTVEAKIRQAETEIEGLRTKLTKREKALARLTSTNGKSLIESALKDQIKCAEAAIVAVTEAQNIFNELLAILDDYEYRHESAPPAATVQFRNNMSPGEMIEAYRAAMGGPRGTWAP